MAFTPKLLDENWDVSGMVDVMKLVARERVRQVCQYGLNDNIEDGTGPDVRWMQHTDINLDLRTGTEIQTAFRGEYERYERDHGKPTWMHLVREELAEAFQEDDPERLAEELVQVAALCVSWVEKIRARGEMT